MKNRYLILGETPRDLAFDFDKYSNNITEIITNNSERTPFVIGLFGDWGSGKTTLMKQIQKTINSIKQPTDVNKRMFISLYFNAWEYQNEDNIWAPLLIQIIDSVIAETPNNKIEVLKKKYMIIKRVVQTKLMNNVSFDVENLIKESLGKLSILDSTLEDFDKQTEALFSNLDKIADKIYLKFLSEYGRLRENFQLIMREANTPVIIFIDDLDRLSNYTKSISMLEALSLWLTVPNTIYIISFSSKMIESGVRKHFGLLENEKEFVKHYMEKIIQLPIKIPVPTVDEAFNFFTQFLETIPIEEIGIKNFLLPNPRWLKKLVNKIYFIMGLYHDENIDVNLLIKFLVFQERWPNVYHHFINWNTRFSTLKYEFEIFCKQEEINIQLKNEVTEFLNQDPSIGKIGNVPMNREMIAKVSSINMGLE